MILQYWKWGRLRRCDCEPVTVVAWASCLNVRFWPTPARHGRQRAAGSGRPALARHGLMIEATAFLTARCEPDKRHAWSAILRRMLEGFIAKSLTQRSFSHHESVNQMIQVNRQF